MVEFGIDGGAHTRDIHALLIAHRQQQRLCAVDSDVFVERGVLQLHRCHILQSDDVAAQVTIDDSVLHVVDFVKTLIYIDGALILLVLQTATGAGKALAGQFLSDGEIADAVVRQLIGVEVDGNLRHLHTADTHLTHRRHHAQRVLDNLHILVELAVGLVLALERDELRRHIAEVILHPHGNDATRQTRLERLDAVFELRPELILILEILVEFDDDDTHAVARIGVRLLFQHLFIGEDIVLERLGHLLLHLFRRGAGEDGSHDALAHRVVGKLILIDHLQAEDAEDYEATNQQNDDLSVVEAKLLKMSSLLSCHSLLDYLAHSTLAHFLLPLDDE